MAKWYIISSGYRSTELCVKIGSSAKSQHDKELKVYRILKSSGDTNDELAKYIIDQLDFG